MMVETEVPSASTSVDAGGGFVAGLANAEAGSMPCTPYQERTTMSVRGVRLMVVERFPSALTLYRVPEFVATARRNGGVKPVESMRKLPSAPVVPVRTVPVESTRVTVAPATGSPVAAVPLTAEPFPEPPAGLDEDEPPPPHPAMSNEQSSSAPIKRALRYLSFSLGRMAARIALMAIAISTSSSVNPALFFFMLRTSLMML